MLSQKKEIIKMVKEGSLWWAGENKKFRILSVVEANGKTWVHYRDEGKSSDQDSAREYSCYLESFLQRFSPLPE